MLTKTNKSSSDGEKEREHINLERETSVRLITGNVKTIAEMRKKAGHTRCGNAKNVFFEDDQIRDMIKRAG